MKYARRRKATQFWLAGRDDINDEMCKIFSEAGVQYVDQITDEVLQKAVKSCLSLPRVGKLTAEKILRHGTMDWVKEVISWEDDEAISQEELDRRIERVRDKRLDAMGLRIVLGDGWRTIP